MKQDIRLLSYREKISEENHPINKITWEAIAELQVYKNNVPDGNSFHLKYALAKDVLPRDRWKEFGRPVTNKSIFFEIEVPLQKAIENKQWSDIKKRVLFHPYIIQDDWDVFNYLRQDVQKINSNNYLGVGEEEWYGLFIHYMPYSCIRPFRSLGESQKL